MAQYDGLKLTIAGRDLIAKAIAGAQLTFTRVAIGDGILPEGADIYTMTDLVHTMMDIGISDCMAQTVGQAVVRVIVKNEGLPTGFFAREIGLFAEDPDDGEILYGYTNNENRSDYVPADGGPDVYRHVIRLVTVIDQAQNVTAIINGDPIGVTEEELDYKISQVGQTIINLFQPAATPITDFWTRKTGDMNILRPTSVDEARSIILGTTDIPSMNRRLERAEDNIAEIILVLDAQNIYPEYSHYLLENFNPPDQIDMYSCAVLSVVAGDDSLDCSPVAGMIPGSTYTITDGISFELVQVKSVSIENGIQRVILEAPVSNTYRLDNCHLYRTSATIQDGKVYGPTTSRTYAWSTPNAWQGQDADAEFDIPLAVTVGGNYQINGDIEITSEGLLTLAAA
jgi:hypothetical protein